MLSFIAFLLHLRIIILIILIISYNRFNMWTVISHYGSYASKMSVKNWQVGKLAKSLQVFLKEEVDEIMSLGNSIHSLTKRLLKNIFRCVILVNFFVSRCCSPRFPLAGLSTCRLCVSCGGAVNSRQVSPLLYLKNSIRSPRVE